MKEYKIWFEHEGWYWSLEDKEAGMITDQVGPYASEVQAIASLLAYATKIEL